MVFGTNISSNSAMIYAALSNRDPLHLEVAAEREEEVGGVDKYLGVEGAGFEELCEKIERQSERFGCRRERGGEMVVDVEDGGFIIRRKEGGDIRSKTVIISTKEMKKMVRVPEEIKNVAGTAKTNIPGLFVCGTANENKINEALVLSGSGVMAAMDARWYLD